MSLKDHQKQVDNWAHQFVKPYWEPLAQMARLAEETGEVARAMNHYHGEKKVKESEGTPNLGQELTDVIFTVCCIANSNGIDLQKEWEEMMQKKHYGRDKNRFERQPK